MANGKLYIRVKKDGFIYDYNQFLARNPECEVVSEEVLFPERFAPEHVIPELGKIRRSKAALDLSTAGISEPPVYTSPELAADASRRLPK